MFSRALLSNARNGATKSVSSVSSLLRRSFQQQLMASVVRSSVSFSTQAATLKKESKNAMFCFQCEQTDNHSTGCTTVGVCGKTPETAGAQDLMVHSLKVLSSYTTALRNEKKLPAALESKVNDLFRNSLFATLTNVNFDEDRFVNYLEEAKGLLKELKAIAGERNMEGDVKLNFSSNKDELHKLAEIVGVEERKARIGNADILGLIELIAYGVKGTTAYYDHAYRLGKGSAEVDRKLQEIFAKIHTSRDAGELLATALAVGELNLHVMGLLDGGHNEKLGAPTPIKVNCNPVPGKAILVSGHDLVDLKALLEQTKDKGINIYTHGEMLPAHGYPELKKYPHLVGHFGGAWQLQKMEFGAFPGPILMTSNCIVEPRKKYKHRIFTTNAVGFPGVKHIPNTDYSEIIKSALEEEGFTAKDVPEKESFVTTGFGHAAVMSVAPKVIEAVKAGKITRFFVIGGCDGSEGERSYFTDLAKATPPSSVILTLGCGKYRFNKLPLGDIDGIPRILDMGQCNDSFSAIQVAVALANAFKCGVNDLPLSFAISWFEQKAVAVLLTLLHLKIQNIHIGPNLPAFVTPNMLKILVDNFKLQPTNVVNVKSDLELMVAGK